MPWFTQPAKVQKLLNRLIKPVPLTHTEELHNLLDLVTQKLWAKNVEYSTMLRNP